MQECRSILSKEDIDFVCDLAIRAGKMAAEMRGSISVSQKTGPSDLVTCADIALSKLILEELHMRFPLDQLISEEETGAASTANGRTWLIDPIDGTENYIKGGSEYAVMIGLLVDKVVEFGCVYRPDTDYCYYGGIKFGVWHRTEERQPAPVEPYSKPAISPPVRLMMGSRDRKKNPWISDLPDIEWLQSGSVGVKVIKVLQDEADVFVHLAGKLKVWDTAGPVAIALGAGLEVGTMKENELEFSLPEILHGTVVIVGRPGALDWTRRTLIAPV